MGAAGGNERPVNVRRNGYLVSLGVLESYVTLNQPWIKEWLWRIWLVWILPVLWGLLPYSLSVSFGPIKGAQPEGTTWATNFPHLQDREVPNYYCLFFFQRVFHSLIRRPVTEGCHLFLGSASPRRCDRLERQLVEAFRLGLDIRECLALVFLTWILSESRTQCGQSYLPLGLPQWFWSAVVLPIRSPSHRALPSLKSHFRLVRWLFKWSEVDRGLSIIPLMDTRISQIRLLVGISQINRV